MADRKPTSHETLERAYDIAKSFCIWNTSIWGNVIDDERMDTHCPACGELAIGRSGYLGENVQNYMKDKNKCPE